MNDLIRFVKQKSVTRVLVFLLLVFVLYLVRSMIDIILMTFIFSYLITRLENFILKRASIYRPIIVIILYALIVVCLTLLLVKYVPIIIEQLNQLIKFGNAFFTTKSNNQIIDYIVKMGNDFNITKYTDKGFTFLLSSLKSTGTVMMNIFIALMLSLFFSLGREHLLVFTKQFETSKIAFIYEEMKFFGVKFVRTFGKVIEAQFLIALVNCVLTTIVLWILHFPQLLTLSIMIFLLGLIPVAGVVLSLIPLSIVGFSIGGIKYIIYVIILIVVIHAIESYILNPKLMSAKTNLPVFYTFIILIFGEHFFGIWGLIVGIPVVMFFLDVLEVTGQEGKLGGNKKMT